MAIAGLGAALAASSGTVQVKKLPPLPRAIAGQFVGTVDNNVVVAGGSYWTSPPNDGGVKIWEDQIQALAPDGTSWQNVARLPRPLAYGGAVSLKHGLVLAGGENNTAVSSKVWVLKANDGRWRLSRWPDLPGPLTNFSMAFAGGRIYVFGGQSSKDSLASAHLWSLAVHANGTPAAAWNEGPPLPGPGRILAAAVGCGDKLYIIGGAALEKSRNGIPVRRYLREAWSYDAVQKWVRLPDPPAAAVGAPAVCVDGHSPLLIGGDDGHMAGVVLRPGEKHPGFSHAVLRYDPASNTWTEVGQVPVGLVTTGAAVLNNGRTVIPGGEDRPGSRSDLVLELSHTEGEWAK